GRPGERDGAALDFAVQKVMAGLHRRLDAAGAPALRLVAGNQEWTVGTGEPAATVSADGYEFLRAMIGRRSRAQIAALAWEGDARTEVRVLSLKPLPTRPANRRPASSWYPMSNAPIRPWRLPSPGIHPPTTNSCSLRIFSFSQVRARRPAS